MPPIASNSFTPSAHCNGNELQHLMIYLNIECNVQRVVMIKYIEVINRCFCL